MNLTPVDEIECRRSWRLRRLPERRLESCKRVSVGVKRSSTIRVDGNTYSVDSRGCPGRC